MSKRLVTPGDVRRYLANLINNLENKKVDAALAGKLGYLANILVKCMEVGFQQSKVDALVSRLDELESRIER